MTMCCFFACWSGAFAKLQSVASSTIAFACAATAWLTPLAYSAGFEWPSKIVTFHPSTAAAFLIDAAGSEQPVSVWSHEITQMLWFRFGFGVDFGLPFASDGL